MKLGHGSARSELVGMTEGAKTLLQKDCDGNCAGGPNRNHPKNRCLTSPSDRAVLHLMILGGRYHGMVRARYKCVSVRVIFVWHNREAKGSHSGAAGEETKAASALKATSTRTGHIFPLTRRPGSSL